MIYTQMHPRFGGVHFFLLQFMGESAILELSGMVNEFQGCIARIPNLAKARFAGFVCCIHLQLSEKK